VSVRRVSAVLARLPDSRERDSGWRQLVDAISLQGGTQGTFLTDTFPGPTGGDDLDTSAGGTVDGSGVLETVGGSPIYELAHPLDSADDPHDISVKAGDVIDFCAKVVVGSDQRTFPHRAAAVPRGAPSGESRSSAFRLAGTCTSPSSRPESAPSRRRG